MMRRKRAIADRFLQETQLASPRYELVDNDEKFQLSVDVPGVKMDDIDVSLEDGYLTVSGQRMSSNDSSRFASKFSQTFSLDAAVDVERISASLSDGVLVVEAPKDMKRLEENVVKIPVVQGQSLASMKDTVKEDDKTSTIAYGDDGSGDGDNDVVGEDVSEDVLDVDESNVEASGDDDKGSVIEPVS